jgi:RNA polymerase sigma factor (sigma-70 family)
MRSDAALAERFAAGNEAAFDVLYERHRPVVLAVSMGVLGTTQDAEDATQETFSALAVALQTKPPAELRPWLIRVARNASIDTTRRRRHRLLTLDGELPDVPARSSSAGQAELAVVLDGIRELPEAQRMALLMRELGGHSYSGIAEFLETEEEAVKGLIARARVGLRTYREATDLPCATARATIASEPDGRRYDKTIRRHLRTCGSCRSYRSALRDDAKALRAALPLPAGSVATGGISTGMLTAAKGTLLGYGLTQAATTCAAAACGVGAIGGMVFVAPVHKLGLPPILAAAKSAPAHKHTVVRAAPKTSHTVVLPVHESTPAVAPVVTPAATASTPAVTHTPAVHRSTHAHRHAPSFTKVKLPPLTHSTASAPNRTAVTHQSPPQATAAAGAVVTSAGNSDHGHGYGHAHQNQSTPPPGSTASPTTGNGQSGSDTSNSGTSGSGTSGSGTSNSNSHGQSQSGGGGHHYGDPSAGVARGGGPSVSGAAGASATTALAASAGVSGSTSSSSTGAGSIDATSTKGGSHGHGRGSQSMAASRPAQGNSSQVSSSHGNSSHGNSSHGGSSHGGSGGNVSTAGSAQQSSWTGYQSSWGSSHQGGWGHYPAPGAGRRSAAFEHHGEALPDTDADGGEAVAAAAVVQLVRHASEDPRA